MILFFQCAGINVEPTLAINENSDDFLEELSLFRKVDNSEASHLAQVYKGESSHISEKLLGLVDSDGFLPSLPDRIHGHQALKTALTKIAILDHCRESPAGKFESFLRWSYEEFFFVREAVILALMHFTRGSEKSILKETKSKSLVRRFGSIENAVWDLILVRDWSRRVAQQPQTKQLWLLCSRDRALQSLARRIHLNEIALESANDYVLKMLQERFSRTSGKKIFAQYLNMLANQNSMGRASNQADFSPYDGEILPDLEDQLRIL